MFLYDYSKHLNEFVVIKRSLEKRNVSSSTFVNSTILLIINSLSGHFAFKQTFKNEGKETKKKSSKKSNTQISAL